MPISIWRSPSANVGVPFGGTVPEVTVPEVTVPEARAIKSPFADSPAEKVAFYEKPLPGGGDIRLTLG